jgi:hypothetical protein
MIEESLSIFLYGMKAPMTMEKCRGRLAKFFVLIGRQHNFLRRLALGEKTSTPWPASVLMPLLTIRFLATRLFFSICVIFRHKLSTALQTIEHV